MKQDKELIELQHKLKMEQLAYERETARKIHEWQLETQRIKTAEIRKDRELRAAGSYKY